MIAWRYITTWIYSYVGIITWHVIFIVNDDSFIDRINIKKLLTMVDKIILGIVVAYK